MKTKASKQPKQNKPAARLKDLAAKNNPRAGGSTKSDYQHIDLYKNVWINQ